MKTAFLALVACALAAGLFLPVNAEQSEDAGMDTGAELILSEELEKTEGIAVCPDGRMFTAENLSGKVLEVLSDDEVTLYRDGFRHPAGMACDQENRLYVLEFSKGVLKRISANGKDVDEVASGFDNPNGITVASNGTIYVSDSKSGKVYEVAQNGDKKVLVEGISYPNGLALDAQEKTLFINLTLGSKTIMTPVEGKHKGKTKTAARGLRTADGITPDGEGGFFVCLFEKGSVVRLSGKAEVEIIAEGMTGPASPALRDGVLYVTSLTGKGLYRIETTQED